MNKAQLSTLGFDDSTWTRSGKFLRVACSACEAVVINGTPCHEYGCSHDVQECKGCNELIPRWNSNKYCKDCQ